MSTVYPDRETSRVRAGCPPVLAADVSQNDVVDPPVEWPPGPPSRHRLRHAATHSTDRVVDVTDALPRGLVLDEDELDGDAIAEDVPVAQLTAGRALRLLDAAVEHMRTVLETSTDSTASARVERAISDVARATENLRDIAGGPTGDEAA